MIGRAGQTVTTELVVTVAADVAVWAEQCGDTTVGEAAHRFPDRRELVSQTVSCCPRTPAPPRTRRWNEGLGIHPTRRYSPALEPSALRKVRVVPSYCKP